jgi:ferrochelatase
MQSERIVVLNNLGGPRSIDEVELFLYDLLSDPNVIQIPKFISFIQKPLARFIAKRRAVKSQKLYSEIGGKSPLVKITHQQATLLEETINSPVLYFMNCGKPNTEDLKASLKDNLDNLKEIIFIPLFPQYSTTTSKTSIEKMEKLCQELSIKDKLKVVKDFPTNSFFIQAWVERIEMKLKHTQGNATILFSAHGIPQRYVDHGDPYLEQLKLSVEAIMNKLNQEIPYKLCFQSKFGPEKWLTPSVETVLDSLPKGGEVVVVPISFVCDHLETTQELGREIREHANQLGLKYHLVPGLNCSKLFIQCLADLVQNA